MRLAVSFFSKAYAGTTALAFAAAFLFCFARHYRRALVNHCDPAGWVGGNRKKIQWTTFLINKKTWFLVVCACKIRQQPPITTDTKQHLLQTFRFSFRLRSENEWLPSLSAVIGDHYPERGVFRYLMATTSGPRLAIALAHHRLFAPLADTADSAILTRWTFLFYFLWSEFLCTDWSSLFVVVFSVRVFEKGLQSVCRQAQAHKLSIINNANI